MWGCILLKAEEKVANKSLAWDQVFSEVLEHSVRYKKFGIPIERQISKDQVFRFKKHNNV